MSPEIQEWSHKSRSRINTGNLYLLARPIWSDIEGWWWSVLCCSVVGCVNSCTCWHAVTMSDISVSRHYYGFTNPWSVSLCLSVCLSVCPHCLCFTSVISDSVVFCLKLSVNHSDIIYYVYVRNADSRLWWRLRCAITYCL